MWKDLNSGIEGELTRAFHIIVNLHLHNNQLIN